MTAPDQFTAQGKGARGSNVPQEMPIPAAYAALPDDLSSGAGPLPESTDYR